MDPTDPLSWSGNKVACDLISFWSAVKYCMTVNHNRGIKKTFITGITPLMLIQNSSCFKFAQNISFDPEFSTMCGLTQSDVLAALKIVYKDQKKVEQCLHELTSYTNGYHFCGETTVPTVFNPDAVMWYLKDILEDEKPDLANLPGSDCSPSFHDICSSLTEAVRAMQFVLQKENNGNYRKIPYENIVDNFKLEELATGEAKGDAPDWKFLVYGETAGYQVSKQSEDDGFVDLLIESKTWYTVVGFKNIELPYLDLQGIKDEEMVQHLTDMSLTDILHLQFNKRDEFRSGTIQKWVDGEVYDQLRSYIMGQTVQDNSVGKTIRAFVVVIIGSCQILVREMNSDGKWQGRWNLVLEPDYNYWCTEGDEA
ncbi:hypothetical protein BDD12DRAFT_807873 [Trichophaea hybrida]|nr:hypothetical protein BDD12DRAFT_807873 [Trichophaea hybrida]